MFSKICNGCFIRPTGLEVILFHNRSVYSHLALPCPTPLLFFYLSLSLTRMQSLSSPPLPSFRQHREYIAFLYSTQEEVLRSQQQRKAKAQKVYSVYPSLLRLEKV